MASKHFIGGVVGEPRRSRGGRDWSAGAITKMDMKVFMETGMVPGKWET